MCTARAADEEPQFVCRHFFGERWLIADKQCRSGRVGSGNGNRKRLPAIQLRTMHDRLRRMEYWGYKKPGMATTKARAECSFGVLVPVSRSKKKSFLGAENGSTFRTPKLPTRFWHRQSVTNFGGHFWGPKNDPTTGPSEIPFFSLGISVTGALDLKPG